MPKLASLFSLLGIGFVLVAFEHRSWGWLYLWPGGSFLAVGMAYARVEPRVLGKRSDGTLKAIHVFLLLPYFCLIWLLWFIYASIRRSQRMNEVAPGLWIGQRTQERHLPSDTALVVDMTSEFWEPAEIRRGGEQRRYVCVPTLDGGAPDVETFRAVVDEVARTTSTVYVHCAQGNGRAATVAAAVLIRRKLAKNVDEAIRMLREARPSVLLGEGQKRRVAETTAQSLAGQPR